VASSETRASSSDNNYNYHYTNNNNTDVSISLFRTSSRRHVAAVKTEAKLIFSLATWPLLMARRRTPSPPPVAKAQTSTQTRRANTNCRASIGQARAWRWRPGGEILAAPQPAGRAQFDKPSGSWPSK
jgi:hypothetical protein